MSVDQLESALLKLSPQERLKFAVWFDDHREELIGDDDLSEEQKAELLSRREQFLANPALAEPWAGTADSILQHLHERRTKKAASGGQ